MSTDEFGIIRRFFTRQPVNREDVVTGVGDDGAVLRLPAAIELVVCMDTLVAGVHFAADTSAAAIGHKALAVNLSDLAAMGAEPAWVTLSVTLPESDPDWLADFSEAFFRLAAQHHVQLVGGDTTRGPLSITVQAHGFVPAGQALSRRGAQPGDHLFVTGTLGDAGLALQAPAVAGADCRRRLDYPEPRLGAGLALRGIASAVIDVSDGLLADLGHLLPAEGPGAAIQVDDLPRSAAFITGVKQLPADRQSLFYEVPLAAGDDYELCFTVPESRCEEMLAKLASVPCGCTQIGIIEQQPGIRCVRQDGSMYEPEDTGYRHFDGTNGSQDMTNHSSKQKKIPSPSGRRQG